MCRGAPPVARITLPVGGRVLGRLLYTQLPYLKRAGKGGGFAEMDDGFEF